MDVKKAAEDILASVNIQINGGRPWDICVKDDRFFSRVIQQGSLGLGESYMDGWWKCERLDEFFTKILTDDVRNKIKKHWPVIVQAILAGLFNQQRPSKAFEIGQKHYDVGNDLYKAMLDKRMVYTCGYWAGAENLDQAQENKLNLVCKKIGLKAGDRVLDIGCGWGSFAKYASENYGVEVVGITVSKEQLELGQENTKGLPVELRLQDYRDITGEFDHVVSLGMFEHVGYKNYRTYMEVVHRVLKDDGMFLLHTIGGLKSGRTTDPWIAKYIFPNSMLPSMKQIASAIEGLFVVEDWHSFGADYDKTLMAWHQNISNAWPKNNRYDERFRRMWSYYLLASAGSFRSRKNQLWQIVMHKHGIKGGYQSIR
ncbi:MAG: cyclopropane fatty acyl phospholipid synthase [Patescibacteria group bacterium]